MSTSGGGDTTSSNSDALEMATPPTLVFRQLHQQLRAFANQTMHDDDVQHYAAQLQRHERELLALLQWEPPQPRERAALQANHVKVAGKSIDVSTVIQQEILKLSDEFQLSEARCFELWYLASDAPRRAWVEREDQLPTDSIAGSIPAAARHLLVSETEHKLNLLKELLRLRFDDQLDPKRRQLIVTFTNNLMANGLLKNMIRAYDTQLPTLLQLPHTVAQSAGYWHCLLADAIVFAVSSCRAVPHEVLSTVTLLQTLCTRLNATVANVSPHIVNLTAYAQLFERGSLAGTSPEAAVKQVACMLQTLTTIHVALLTMLLQTTETLDRETGDVVTGHVLTPDFACVVREIHATVVDAKWTHNGFQSVAMLAWAAGLSTMDERLVSEAALAPTIVKRSLEQSAFTTMNDILLQYFPDRKHDPLLYHIFERRFEQLLVTYSTRLLIDVPTFADQAVVAAMQTENLHADDETVGWTGDCLEHLIAFATTLCTRDVTFSTTFWRVEDEEAVAAGSDVATEASASAPSCHAFLLACRDAAYKNPACFAAYMRLVAAAASGPDDCAQLAFHHIKQNPPILNWEQFFSVMAKYQRLLTDAEKPANGFSLQTAAFVDGRSGGGSVGSNAPGPRFIRPKELEALEMIQLVLQAVIRDHQLALLLFHNHDWSPIPTFVAFLQCRIPSSLKGALMKTLALFARVPEIAPFVWRHVDALQILRTTGDTTMYGDEDIAFELEHYESLAKAYPATRGFVTLLSELFANPHAWKAFEGDGRVEAIQFYFDYLIERVLLKFDVRKYAHEEEKWALVNGALAIVKKILRHASTGTDGSAGLAHQLLARILSSSALLDKLLRILSSDGGVESLEHAADDVHLEQAFFYCLELVKQTAEATHGSLTYARSDSLHPQQQQRRSGALSHLTKSSALGVLREQCVQHALEVVVLVLERDTVFVSADLNKQLSQRLQVERLDTILCRHRTDFVRILQYIKYTKSAHIPLLATVVLRLVSDRLRGADLVDLLLDSGASDDIALGYTNRLLNVYDDDDDDDDDGDTDSSAGANQPLDGRSCSANDNAVVTLSSAKKRKRLASSILAPYELLPLETTSTHSIRAAILDLVLANLAKPAPNVAHVLLGVLDPRSSSDSQRFMLDAIVSLVASPAFGLECPSIAAQCHRVVHAVVTQTFASATTLRLLEHPAHDYFGTQLELFGSVYHVRHRRNARDAVAELAMRGWFFKTLAVYVHVALHAEPPQMKQVNRVMAQLLLSTTDDDEDAVYGFAPPQQQHPMLLLQLLDESSFHLAPPAVPAHAHAVALAEQATCTVDDGYYKWLKVDLERFCQALQTLDVSASGAVDYFAASAFKRFRSSGGLSNSNSGTSVDALLQWAVQWNTYSERVAAESHALNSLRELIEVVVLDYFALPGGGGSESDATETLGALWQGLEAVASSDVRLELVGSIVSAVLSKLTDVSGLSAQLFEIVARLALLLFAHLRQPSTTTDDDDAPLESQARQSFAFLELVLRAIVSSGQATGNPVAARNARTLLYSCIVNVLHTLRSTGNDSDAAAARNPLGLAAAATSASQRIAVLTAQVVDVICRDASDGDDPLSMALAISALEAVVAFDGATSVVQICRERGYLLHFIGVFQRLCDMDAALDRGVSVATAASNDVIKSRALPAGIDAATLGTMYECFLSLFSKVAATNDGALALLEGGLVRALTEARNLPTHRPRSVRPHDSSSVARASSIAFERAERAYYRKWLPVVRLLSALGASLPQNRSLAAQTLALVSAHRKLFTTVLKCDPSSSSASPPPSLSLLHELSYVTFVFRYVTQFVDLCDKALPAVTWEKIAQLLLHVFMVYSRELVPPVRDDDDDDDSTTMRDDDDRDSTWWRATQPRSATELRDDSVRRAALCNECEHRVVDSTARDAASALLRLSAFDEEKLFAARMVLCNTVAFCATRMMRSVDDGSHMLAGKTPLLTVAARAVTNSSSGFSSAFDARVRAASAPLWTLAPSLSDFAARFDAAVDALASSKQLLEALARMSDCSSTSEHVGSTSGAWSLRRRAVREHVCATNHAQSVVAYHADSMGFVVENMAVVLLLHFAHYLTDSATARTPTVRHVLVQVLTTIGDIESNPFVHALARRLRELASSN